MSQTLRRHSMSQNMQQSFNENRSANGLLRRYRGLLSFVKFVHFFSYLFFRSHKFAFSVKYIVCSCYVDAHPNHQMPSVHVFVRLHQKLVIHLGNSPELIWDTKIGVHP